MKTLGVIAAAVFLAASLAHPTLGAGWFWDIGNAIGFCAFSGLLFLAYTGAPSTDLKPHRLLGNAVLLIAAMHVFWMLLGDPVVVEYILPGAPIYMWAGLVAFVLLNVLLLIGLPGFRRQIYRHRDSFRRWHRWIAIVTIAATCWHIVGSGHYLRASYQWAPMLAIAAAACFAPRFIARKSDLNAWASRQFLGFTLVATAAFALVRNL